MQFGLLSQSERYAPISAHAWEEDLWEIVMAEKLGFTEVWIAEHFGTQRQGVVSAADLLICKAAALTKRIRLGPGIRALPLYHPVHVATEAAVCDHLTGGRYLAGFGTGGNMGDVTRQLGIGENSQKYERMYEAIDIIMKCWTATEPFSYEGQFWQCEDVSINPKPFQKPHPPAGVACSRTASTLEFAAKQHLLPLVSFHDSPPVLKEMADVFVGAAREAGRRAVRGDIRVPRFIHVADSTKRARTEVRDAITPMLERRKRTFPWQFERWLPPSGKMEDVTFDYLVDAGAIFVGDPEAVHEGIKAAYDEIGGFGVLLLLAGKDIGTRAQRMRSWRLFMQHVAPRLADLDPDRRRPLPSLP